MPPSPLRPLALACLAAVIATPAGAQACDCPTPLFPARWSLFIGTGGAIVRTATINERLAAAGYAALSRDAIGFGGGAYGSFGPLRLGAEHLRFDAGGESTPAGLSARLESVSTSITVGWDLVPRRRYSVVPTLGVGRGSFRVTVGDRNGGAPAPSAPPPTFDEILAAPGTSSRIAGGHWVFEPMIVADLLLARRPGALRGITLGVRAGYRIAPNRPDWEYRGAAASGGPVDQATGPSLRLTLGVGGR